MGGFDVGGLFGALQLDDSQFLEAVRRSGGASKAFSVVLDETTKTYLGLARAIEASGGKLEGFSDDLKKTLSEMSANDSTARRYADALGQVQKRLTDIGYINNRTNTEELDAWRLKSARAQQQMSAAKAEFASRQDMAGLTARLRAEEEAGTRATIKGLELERNFRLDRDAKLSASETEYSNLVKQLRAQEAKAALDAGKVIEKDAIARQKELESIMLGDAAAQQRIAKETQQAIEKAERDRFTAYRRQMEQARALQTIGTLGVASGGALLGAEFLFGHSAATFQEEMSKSLAVIGTVSIAMEDRLASAVREAAKATGLAAKDIAGSLAVMAKGGLDAEQSIASVGKFAKYAVATNTDLKESTKQVLTVMESLGIESSQLGHVMNVLAEGGRLARGSVEQLAVAMEGKAGAALRATHADIEQAVAIVVTLAKVGYEGSAAQTQLASSIARMSKAAQDHGVVLLNVNKEQVKWKDIVYDTAGNARSLVEIVNNLSAAFKGHTKAEIDAFFNALKLGSDRGVSGIRALVGESGTLDGVESHLRKGGETIEEIFGTRLKSPIVQMNIAKAHLTDLSITMGIAVVAAAESAYKALNPLFKLVESAVKWFGDLNPHVQTAIAGIVGITGATLLGLGTLALFGSHLLSVAASLRILSITAGAAGATGAVTGLTAGFSALALALAPVAIAMATVVATYKTIDTFSKAASGPGTAAQKFGVGLFNIVAPSIFPFVSSSSPTAAAQKTAEAATGPLSDFRKYLEDFGKAAKAQYAEMIGGLFKDPTKEAKDAEAALRSTLKLDKVREDLKRLSDNLSGDRDNITQEQHEVVYQYVQAISTMIGSGVDTRVLEQKVTRARDILASFLKENRVLAAERAHEAALDAANAEHNYKLDEADEKLAEARINTTTRLTAAHLTFAKALEKAHEESVKLFEGKSTDTNPSARTLGQQLIQFGVPPSFAAAVQKTHDIEEAFKSMGLTSQEALSSNALEAKRFYDWLVGIGAQSKDVDIALVHLWEAQAASMGISADKVDSRYRELAQSVKNSVTEANKAWQRGLNELGRGLQTVARDIAGGLTNLLPIFDSSTSGSDPISTLVQSLRGAFEKLAAYNDPKKALQSLVDSIKNAGSTAQANAIAVRYFGDTAGPLLAKELRDGTISANDLSKAMGLATVSTQDFGNKTATQLSRFTQLWQKAVRDILQLIAKELIELGFKKLIDWMFKVGTASSTMASDVQAAIHKIGVAIGLIKPTQSSIKVGSIPAPVSSGTTPPNENTDAARNAVAIAMAAATVANTVAEIINTVATAANTAAIQANIAIMGDVLKEQVHSTVRAIDSDGKLITVEKEDTVQTAKNTTAEISNTQATIANTNAIIANTTATLANTTALWALTGVITALMYKLATQSIGGVITQFIGGGGGGGTFDPFGGFGGIFGGGWPPYYGIGTGGGGGGFPVDWPPDWGAFESNSRADKAIHVHGDVHVQASSPEQFVRQLKRNRVIKSVS